ncbi:MAG: cytochrome b/b6 domain-containing protein [Planctomycetaceae bacterium]|jgi:cytochrome b|nr:cytochrome b/b6 domain-containing protein [Phycisphaerales bacterium]MCE2654545.1 cytochrome b/b6 domain-containing protein [Planctomycetaceae bacterium]
MSTTLIWDAPVRVGHALLAGTVCAAAGLAFLTDEHSAWFPWHMLLGLMAVPVVAFRLVWLAVGTRHARLGGLVHSPRRTAAYFAGLLRGRPVAYAGHNPGSAPAIVLMLGLTAALAITGVMMARAGGEGGVVKEVHEVCATALLVVIGLHLAGVLVHTVLHRELIALSMVTGRKQAAVQEAITGTHRLAAAALVAGTGLFAWHLAGSFNPATGTAILPVLGWRLTLGEANDWRSEPQRGEGREERR